MFYLKVLLISRGNREGKNCPGQANFLTSGGLTPFHPSSRKRKYHTKKGSLTEKHKKALLNLRKKIFSRELRMANLSIENHHWHLHESMKVNTMFLVPGYQSELKKKKSTKIIFIAFPMCNEK